MFRFLEQAVVSEPYEIWRNVWLLYFRNLLLDSLDQPSFWRFKSLKDSLPSNQVIEHCSELIEGNRSVSLTIRFLLPKDVFGWTISHSTKKILALTITRL